MTALDGFGLRKHEMRAVQSGEGLHEPGENALRENQLYQERRAAELKKQDAHKRSKRAGLRPVFLRGQRAKNMV